MRPMSVARLLGVGDHIPEEPGERCIARRSQEEAPVVDPCLGHAEAKWVRVAKLPSMPAEVLLNEDKIDALLHCDAHVLSIEMRHETPE